MRRCSFDILSNRPHKLVPRLNCFLFFARRHRIVWKERIAVCGARVGAAVAVRPSDLLRARQQHRHRCTSRFDFYCIEFVVSAR